MCVFVCYVVSRVPEIPGFLSVEESSVVMQLAQLKGLTHSSPAGPLEGPDEQLSQDELFGLLDLNQDGLLQRDEVRNNNTDTFLVVTWCCLTLKVTKMI